MVYLPLRYDHVSSPRVCYCVILPRWMTALGGSFRGKNWLLHPFARRLVLSTYVGEDAAPLCCGTDDMCVLPRGWPRRMRGRPRQMTGTSGLKAGREALGHSTPACLDVR